MNRIAYLVRKFEAYQRLSKGLSNLEMDRRHVKQMRLNKLWINNGVVAERGQNLCQ